MPSLFEKYGTRANNQYKIFQHRDNGSYWREPYPSPHIQILRDSESWLEILGDDPEVT